MGGSGSSSSVATTTLHTRASAVCHAFIIVACIIRVFFLVLGTEISQVTGVTCLRTSKGPYQESVNLEVNLEDRPGVRTRIIDPGEKDSSDPAYRS